ncbi:hypothetical protein BMS3Abin15_01171 [bacterium BMS3Abin15]|nr:hypothetical protein BMS3Abin15_01171 [bacterium BMS3Abin15]HDZ85171.1 hypothetical protein [Candidatus Moranbacteria bacterium]
MFIVSPIDPMFDSKILEEFALNSIRVKELIEKNLNECFVGNQCNDFYMGLFTSVVVVHNITKSLSSDETHDPIIEKKAQDMTFAIAAFLADKISQGNICKNDKQNVDLSDNQMIDRGLGEDDLKKLVSDTMQWTSSDLRLYNNDFLGDKNLDFYKGLMLGYLDLSTMFILQDAMFAIGKHIYIMATYLARVILEREGKFKVESKSSQ